MANMDSLWLYLFALIAMIVIFGTLIIVTRRRNRFQAHLKGLGVELNVSSSPKTDHVPLKEQ